ncbi:MAG: SH3 domain-containing protein [Mariprofundus sp.]
MGCLKHDFIWPGIALLALGLLPACAPLTMVTAIPGALYGVVADEFSDEEESFPYSMDMTLAAIQKALLEMKLNIDLLEIQEEGGYGMVFNNDKLDGEIILTKQTERLTTAQIQVKSTTREESVERVIVQMVHAELKKLHKGAHIQKKQFHNLRAKPNIAAKRLGWFRPGSRLEVVKTTKKGWLKVKMPSGKTAYLKGTIH